MVLCRQLLGQFVREGGGRCEASELQITEPSLTLKLCRSNPSLSFTSGRHFRTKGGFFCFQVKI